MGPFDAKSETSVILHLQIVEGKKRIFAKLSTSQKIQNSILMPDPFAAEGTKVDKVKVQN